MNGINHVFFRNQIAHILVFLISLSYYIHCLCPGIGFGDTAILIDNIQRFVMNTEVNTHPLTVLIGKLFIFLPTENLAYRANLISAFSGAIALSIFFKASFEYHENLITSFICTLALALSYSFFWHSTLVENYSISSIVTSTSLLFYVRIAKRREEKWFYPLFALFGIGIFNHVQMGFLGMGIGIAFLIHFYQIKNRLPFFLKCLLGFLLGLIPWIFLFIRDFLANKNFSLVLKNAFMGSFENIFFSQSLSVAIQEFIIIYIFQFPNLFFLFPSVGIYLLVRNKITLQNFSGPLIHFLTNSFFFAFYGTWDKFAFLLQSFLLLAFFGSFSLSQIQLKPKFIATLINILLFLSILYGLNFYPMVAASGKDPEGLWRYQYNNDYSANLYDQSSYVVLPNKRHFREVEIYCNLIFEKLPKDATLLEDDSRTYYPLADYYQKYYQKRKDIQFLLMNSWGIAGWGLNSQELIKEIRNSVEMGKPFFLASLSNPYSTIVEVISADEGLYFEKFPLSETRWIYQVKTRSLNPKGTMMLKEIWDFKIRDIAEKSTDILYERQLMFSYPNDFWDNSDQVFISAKLNSFFELKLNHTRSETVNLQFNFTAAPDFGIINIYLNQKKIFENLDLYKPNVSRLSQSIQKLQLLGNDNILKFEIVERNQNSNGYKMGIDSVKIVR